MTRLSFSTISAVAALLVAACGTHSAAHNRAATPGAPPSRILEIPATPSEAEPRGARVLIDEPTLKLVSIVLRGGAVLPPHQAAVPVTIVALQGSGTVVAARERLRLGPTHMVVLAPDVPHSVEPDAGTDLVLLVHHLGGIDERHR